MYVHRSGFLLRLFVKGGNKFAIAGVRHLVNVSQGIMGPRWPPEEWKPNMVELEVSIVSDKRKCSNQEQFLYRQWIFNVILSAGCFYVIYGKEITKQGRVFSKYNEF